MNHLDLESLPILGTNERHLLTAREKKLRDIAAIAGWSLGGLVPHARGWQACFWRGGVGAILEKRVARAQLAPWVASEVRRAFRR